MFVGRWCFGRRSCAHEVLEVVQETCTTVLLENVTGLAHPDQSGRSSVDAARDRFDKLGDFGSGWSAVCTELFLLVVLHAFVGRQDVRHVW